MVCKIVSGKSIRGILNYNENKVQDMEATLLLAAGFPKDPDQLSFKNKMQTFDMLTRQNEMTKTNALHISLNFSVKDDLDDDWMRKIALEYMESIGFGDQPFLVYRHFDAAHPHLHIATVNIADGGDRIETHNIGKNQSEKARKEIEILYGLTKAEDQKKETAYMLRPVNLEKVIYGKSETKAAISGIVRDVVSSYKFTSLPELNAVLRQFNILADTGDDGTKMKENKGLLYCLLNEDGERVGVPIKASSIYSSPTLKNLEQKYKPNETARRPYGQRLKHLIDKAIATAHNKDELEAQLKQQGIRILLRENVQGQVYGVTFIDNATRAVFNGSDLGKAYSAKAFFERLPKEAGLSEMENEKQSIPFPGAGTTQAARPDRGTGKDYPAHDQPVIQRLVDFVFAARYEVNMPDPFRKKKKKRLQAE